MTVLIVAGPIALAVVITGVLLFRARIGSSGWLLRKTGEPIDEAMATERFLHPYRYRP